MSNQPKLIDADKLLEWMKGREEASLMGGLGQEIFTLYDVESRIARGAFDPDHIPLPSIKPGEHEKGYDIDNLTISKDSGLDY